MDIKKVQEIVEESVLSDEAKDLIYKMLPEADKPEVKEEIMKVINYEIDTNNVLADEAEEIMSKIEEGDEMEEALEEIEEQKMESLEKESSTKLESLDEEKSQIEEEMKGLSSDEGPMEPSSEASLETPAAEEPVVEAPEAVEPVTSSPVFVPSWQQPVIQETPPASLTNPVTSVPQWNQPVAPIVTNSPVSEAPIPATQPAPFPGQSNQ